MWDYCCRDSFLQSCVTCSATAASAATAAEIGDAVATLGSIGANAAEFGMQNKLEEKLENMEKDEDAKLQHNMAFEAANSFSVLSDIRDAYEKKEGTQIDVYQCLAALAGQFNQANSNKEDFKKALQECCEIAIDKELVPLIKGLTETDLKMIMGLDKHILDDDIKLYEMYKHLAKLPYTILKAKEIIPKVAKTIRMIPNFLCESFRRLRGYNPVQRIVNGGVEMADLGGGQIARSVENTIPRQSIGRFSKAKLAKISVGFNVVSIVLSSLALIYRHAQETNQAKSLQEASDNFSEGMDEMKLFQEIYFPLNGDVIRAAIDEHRLSTLAGNHKAFNDAGDGFQMGLIVDNRSKYTFEVQSFVPFLGAWYFTPSGTLVGSDEVASDFQKEGGGGGVSDLIKKKRYIMNACVSGWSRGSGFEGLFILRAKGWNKIQIPIWFFYGWNKPWQVTGAYANIPDFYGDDKDKIKNHIQNIAHAKNKVKIWRWSTGDVEGGSQVIENDYLRISFSVPDKRIDVTIEDAKHKKSD